MNEKILISGKMSKKQKISMAISILGSAFIALCLFFIIAFGGFRVRSEKDVFYIILIGVMLFNAIIKLFIYLAYGRCEIIITDQNVKGKANFGKEVVLPIYMISSYSIERKFSAITVATSSGVTKFAFINNYAEIGEVLSKKINERQDITSSSRVETAPAVTQSNSMDDLVKLKNLLDAGVITAEEFEAKKKQLLGL